VVGELVFLKLGGSVITDKKREATAQEDIIQRAGQEISQALKARPDLSLVLGHGSGSFGHFVADRYGLRDGIQEGPQSEEYWRGYAETAAVAARLNRLVTDVFLAEGLPIFTLQPSASALCRSGELISMETRPAAEEVKDDNAQRQVVVDGRAQFRKPGQSHAGQHVCPGRVLFCRD